MCLAGWHSKLCHCQLLASVFSCLQARSLATCCLFWCVVDALIFSCDQRERKYEASIKCNIIGLMLLLACVSFAQRQNDYDHSANLAIKTYSWEKVQTKDPLVVDRIKSAVKALWRQRVGRKFPRGMSSLCQRDSTQQNPDSSTTVRGGVAGIRRDWHANTTVEPYKVTLVVDPLRCKKTEKMIWRSSSSDTLRQADKNTKKSTKA